MKSIVDIKKLKNWVGKKEIVSDILTPSLEEKFRATLDIKVNKPQNGEIASSGIHWALAPPIIRSSELGKDSHALRGTFLPLQFLCQEECGQVVKQLFIQTFILVMKW